VDKLQDSDLAPVVTTTSDIDKLHQHAARGGAGIGAAVGRKAGAPSDPARIATNPLPLCSNQIAKALAESAGAIREAEILMPTETRAARDAIITDTTITKRRKQVLLDT
jgi:hypothetical protein